MQNHQNPRGYGYQRPDQFPTSYRSSEDWKRRENRDERWRADEEWSARNDTWRGRDRPPERPRDSWKGDHFQYGIDRAPMPVDDQFLVRYGAKRLNNGNLVDRDGYTLRTRDPDCRAPSPPGYNPGREFRRAERLPDSFSARDYSESLRFDGPSSSRPYQMPPPSYSQRWESFPRNGPRQPRNGPVQRPLLKSSKRKESPPKSEEKEPAKSEEKLKNEDSQKSKDDDLEEKARQQLEMMKQQEMEEERKKRKVEKEKAEKDEVEGEDEYEEVEVPPDEPTPPKPASSPFNVKKPLLSNPPSNYQNFPSKNNIKKALIAQTPPIPPRPQKEDSWFHQYKKQVETFKEQVYGNSLGAPNAPSCAPPAPSYFFQAPPTQPSTSANFYSNPRKEPPRVELPPPGVVQMEPRTSSYSETFGIQTEKPPPSSDSSDSEEDEAIVKLRQIIENYGSNSRS